MKAAIFGDYVQGYSHYIKGVECQDSLRKIDYIKGVYIASTADGHGSENCPYSAEGANIATKVFCKVMSELYGNYEDEEALYVFLRREGSVTLAKGIEREWKREIKAHNLRKKRTVLGTEAELYVLYGTTLLGIMFFGSYLFSFQIGDGNIIGISDDGVEALIGSQYLNGVETHSLAAVSCWKNAEVSIRRIDFAHDIPYLCMLSTDGFSNSFISDEEYYIAAKEYYEAICSHGLMNVRDRLKEWLRETSKKGSGDDITVMFMFIN